MSVETEGASGPQGNTADQHRSNSDALDKAIAAAFDGQNTGGDDYPPQVLKDKAAESRDTNAGDRSGSEKAGAPSNKAEAPQAEATPTGAPEPREAPKHWPEDRRKAFAAWAKEVQDHALAVDKDLQAGFTRKSQELSDQAKFAGDVRKLFSDQHRQQLSQAGLDEVGALQYLMRLHDYASRDPVGYARWYMQQQGITPEHLGYSPTPRQPAQQQPPPPQRQKVSTGDPELDRMLAEADPHPEIAKLRTELGQQNQQLQQALGYLYQEREAERQHRANWARQQEVAAVNGLQKQWTDFRSAQDDHGQLAHPHADALMQPMGALMDTHPVLKSMPDGPDKLAKAYAMAVNADPELSKTVFEAEVSKRLADQQKAAEAERAKKAASVRPATGAPTMPAKKGGLDSAIDAAFAKTGWQ